MPFNQILPGKALPVIAALIAVGLFTTHAEGQKPPQETITAYTAFVPPHNIWAFQHIRELFPTRNVSRQNAPVVPLPKGDVADLSSLAYKANTGEDMTISSMMDATLADGLVVLHKGKLVYEDYRGTMTDMTHHQMMSVTKSFTGTAVSELIINGSLDGQAIIADIMPELAASGFGDATVQQVLDMEVGIDFTEEYTAPDSGIAAYAVVMGGVPVGPDYTGPRTVQAFLASVNKKGNHGDAFHYATPVTDVLGWVYRNTTGENLTDWLSTRIWSQLGMEEDAYVLLLAGGAEFAGGGLNATMRDLARFGQLLLQNGQWGDQQLIPSAVIEDIITNGNRETFRKGNAEWDAKSTLPVKTFQGFSYHNQWWVSHNKHDAYMALGIHGQIIYVAPGADMVAVLTSASPDADTDELWGRNVPALHAIADHLAGASADQ